MRLTLTKGFAVFDPGLRMCSRDRRGLCNTVGAYSGARCSQIRRLLQHGLHDCGRKGIADVA